MKKQREIKTGEFVVITEAKGHLETCGRMIDITSVYGISRVVVTIKTFKNRTEVFTIPYGESKTYPNIRLMRFDEMNLKTKVYWFMRNVVFKNKFNRTYKNVVENED